MTTTVKKIIIGLAGSMSFILIPGVAFASQGSLHPQTLPGGGPPASEQCYNGGCAYITAFNGGNHMMYADWQLNSADYDGLWNPITRVNIKLSWGGSASPQYFKYPINSPTTTVRNQGWHKYSTYGEHTVTMSGYVTTIYTYDYVPPFSSSAYVN